MKEEKWKTGGDKKGASSYANKETLALLSKPANPTPSKTGLLRSFHRDTEKEIKVLLYCEVLQARRHIGEAMCDHIAACNPHRHIRHRKSTMKRVQPVTLIETLLLAYRHITHLGLTLFLI